MDAGNKQVQQERNIGRKENQTTDTMEMDGQPKYFDLDNASLCQGCRMSVCWHGMKSCMACESGSSKPFSSVFLTRLREELKRSDSKLVLQGPGRRGQVLHEGAVERITSCNVNSRRVAMCNTLSLYCYKHGWAAWGLEAAIRDLSDQEPTLATASPYKQDCPVEDDRGPMTHWCSCDNQKDESSAQAELLISEVTSGILTLQAAEAVHCQGEWGYLASEEARFAFEWGIWTGATPQMMADAIWLVGPGRRQLTVDNVNAREIPKGARGSVETTWLHYLFLNNHVNTLLEGLEPLVLGTYMTVQDHKGRAQEDAFTRFAADIARLGNLGRYAVAGAELYRRWPEIKDWHSGCLSTLGMTRGLEFRAWAYQCHWNAWMHYELGSGTDWEHPLPQWMYIGAALGHDAGDLCSDTRRGCADNSYFAVGAHAGYEGVAACLDILCDALEAVVRQDTRGVIELGMVAGSACTTFERTGGKLCACREEHCEGMRVLSQICSNTRIAPNDATELLGVRDALRSQCEGLPPSLEGIELSLDHRDREQVFAETVRAVGTGRDAEQTHRRFQSAYASAAKSMCGELRRKAAYFRQCVTSSGQDVLDLSTGCMCGGVCSTW